MSRLVTTVVRSCPCLRDFDVFGRDNSNCCYLYMKYCQDVPTCFMKHFSNLLLDDSVSRSDIYDVLVKGDLLTNVIGY